MDGFAVRARDTDGASLTAPISASRRAGAVCQYRRCPSGVGQCRDHDRADRAAGRKSDDFRSKFAHHAIRIRAAVPPWKHVRALGEDMVAGELYAHWSHLYVQLTWEPLPDAATTQSALRDDPRRHLTYRQ